MKHPQLRRLNILGTVFLLLLMLVLVISMMDDGPEERVVLLSFDVEPVDGDDSLLEVLDILRDEGIKATFFVTGEYAEEYSELVRWIAKGHEVGCHSYSHKKLTTLDLAGKEEEILKCKQVVEEVIGKKIIGFRAPYTIVDAEVLDILDEEFVYDASRIQGLGVIYPDGYWEMGEVPVSSFLLVPLEDVVWLHYLKMNRLYFKILRDRNAEISSYLFHPHHITKEGEEFKKFINHLKKENARFITHRELIMQHEGG